MAQTSVKILYVVTEDWYFWSHRLATARAARDLGYEVAVATHVGTHADAIRREGFRVLPLPPMRGSKGVLDYLRTVLGLAALYRLEKPDIVHHIALVPTFFGSIAVLLSRLGHSISTMTGLGFVFTSDRPKPRFIRALVVPFLRLVLSFQRHDMIFQNRADRDFFIREKIVAKPRTHLIPGSGVDTELFHPVSEPDGIVTAAFVGRMLRPKGVLDIVEAARVLRQRGTRVRLFLVGTPDPLNPESLTESDLVGWQAEGLLEWSGFRDDIAALWGQAHIALLPSYREGFPKSLLEAAACGRPMVASDVPGCRDIVLHGSTGLLVPLKNGVALADAIQTLVDDPALRRRMGANARTLVETEFSNRRIGDQMQALYRHHLARS